MMMSRRALLTTAALSGAAATAWASRAAASPAATTRSEPATPWYAPMREAIAGVPDGAGGLPTTTAAQVRLVASGGCWQGRSGVAEVRTGRPVPPDARFRIGSVTKTFTTIVVLQLCAEGRLVLDAPVDRYLPGLLPAEYRAMRVRYLLDHRTGLPSPAWPDGVAWQIEHRFDRYTLRQLLGMALANDREFEPGTRQHYTNMGPILAAILIQQVTGRSYAEQIRRRLLRPLGLRDTLVPGDSPDIPGPHAHGYQVLDGSLADVTRWNQSSTAAAGDMISSLRDLDVFVRALFGGRLLPRALQREVFTTPDVCDLLTGEPAAYSAGLTRLATLPDGRTIWGKSGARYGYTAAVAAPAGAASRLIYSVNATDAKSADRNPVVGRIITAGLGLL